MALKDLVRSRLQLDANEVDLDMHRILLRIERLAAESTPRDRAKWTAADMHLRRARYQVRELMHETDRAATA
jgi:hypothetical protein